MKDDEKLKRISFMSGEDFYFLTYLLLICLKGFCNKNMIFNDHRKLTYLMQIITNSSAVGVLIENFNSSNLKPLDKELLFDVYVKGSLHQRDVYKILRSLEIKGVVSVMLTEKIDCFNIKITDSESIKSFFDTNIFAKEMNNIEIIKSHFKRINSLGLEGLISKFFDNYGLKVWAS